ALGEERPQVLQVPLAPAAVALHLREQRRRRLLVAAPEVVGEPEAPPRPPHEGGLHEVVAQDLAAERLPPRQPRERAVLREGLDADDRVVPPVLAVAELPVVESGREHRAVHAARELLQAREQRACVHGRGGGLDHADARVALHELDEADERLAGHQAVGVEHDHVAVAPAPAPAEVGDVAALSLIARLAAAIDATAASVYGENTIVT